MTTPEGAMKPYVIEFHVAGLPHMTNNNRRHWRAVHKHAVKWKKATAQAVWLSGGIPEFPLERAMLTLTRVSSMEPDLDGLISGFKHVLDGLVECGVLANDKPSNIGIPDYRWEKGAPGKGMIKVRVEEFKPQQTLTMGDELK